MAEELPLPDPAQPGSLCYTITSNPAGVSPAPLGATTNPCLHELLRDRGWKRLWSDPREAEGCSGLQEAHPQPVCQFYPKPHLQV